MPHPTPEYVLEKYFGFEPDEYFNKFWGTKKRHAKTWLSYIMVKVLGCDAWRKETFAERALTPTKSNGSQSAMIGFCGGNGVGKSTATKITQQILEEKKINSIIVAFADTIKDILVECFGFTEQEVRGLPQDKLRPNKIWGKSGRETMIGFGEGMKKAFGDDVWVKVKILSLEKNKPDGVLIFEDLRFESEAKYLQEHNGVIIGLTRQRDKEVAKTDFILSDVFIDYSINNDKGIKELSCELRKKLKDM